MLTFIYIATSHHVTLHYGVLPVVFCPDATDRLTPLPLLSSAGAGPVSAPGVTPADVWSPAIAHCYNPPR